MGERGEKPREAYVLPLDAVETARLHAQAHYLDNSTNPLLRRYVRPGMKCIELGPGLGASTEVIRETLGRAGSLTVVDQGEAFLNYVRARLEHTGNLGVAFEHNTAETLAFPAALDLVFGRAMLHHTTDPAAVYARAAAALEPGGFVIFQEPVVSGIFRHDLPDAVAQIWRWYLALGAANGVHFDVGDRLGEFATDAGLQIVEMAGHEPFMVSASDLEVYPQLMSVLRDQLREKGIASDAEVDGVAERLRAVADAGRPMPYVPFVHCVAMRPLHTD